MAFKGKVIGPVFIALLCSCCLITTILGKCSDDSDKSPTLTANPNRKDGTAVYLLLDVSGSMQDPVKNDKGQDEAKISIAKRNAIDVCKSVAGYAQENKERDIQMAIACFSDKFTIKYAMAKPDLEKMTAAINSLNPEGNTAIGDAVVNAQRALDQTGLRGQHILIITDGENNTGAAPEKVAIEMNKLAKELRPSMWLVAFDVKADVFNGVKSQGWQVFGATNGTELKAHLDEVVGQHILIEQ